MNLIFKLALIILLSNVAILSAQTKEMTICDSLYNAKQLLEARDCYSVVIKSRTATDKDKMMSAMLAKMINDTAQVIIKTADSLYDINEKNMAFKKYLEAALYISNSGMLWSRISKLYAEFYENSNELGRENILNDIKVKQDSMFALKYFNSSRILLITHLEIAHKNKDSELSKFDNVVDSLKFLDKYPTYENDGNFITERFYYGKHQFKFQKRDLKGTLLNDGYFSNELPDSISIQYYPDGKIKYKFKWTNGKLNGERLYFYQDGNVGSYGIYFEGLRQGKFVEYYQDGKIKAESYFTNDTLNGEQIEYFPSSKYSLKVNYRMGKLNGKYIEYYESENKKVEANYVNDILDGIWLEWYENGYKKTEKHYTKGKASSVLFFMEDGKPFPNDFDK